MRLIDEVKNEIIQSHSISAPVVNPDIKKVKRPMSKEEREAYREKLIEKEEREALKRMGLAPNRRKRGDRNEKPLANDADKSDKSEKTKKVEGVEKVERVAVKKVNVKRVARPNKANKPKQLKTINLPNGDQLVLFYIPSAV